MEKKNIKVPIEISARHIHLAKKDFKTLFKKEEPGFFKKLNQHQFGAKETIEIRNKNKAIKNVRLVAPFRDKTQVEISITDAIYLGIKPAITMSGDLKNASAIEIRGSKGKLKLKHGAIVSQRHLHLNPEQAKKLGLKHKDIISILVEGKRKIVFGNVIVRIDPIYNLCVHLDTDEANAAGIFGKGVGYLIKS